MCCSRRLDWGVGTWIAKGACIFTSKAPSLLQNICLVFLVGSWNKKKNPCQSYHFIPVLLIRWKADTSKLKKWEPRKKNNLITVKCCELIGLLHQPLTPDVSTHRADYYSCAPLIKVWVRDDAAVAATAAAVDWRDKTTILHQRITNKLTDCLWLDSWPRPSLFSLDGMFFFAWTVTLQQR